MSVAEKIKEVFAVNKDQCGDTFYLIKASAQIRMISSIKGQQLSAFEDFKLKWFLVTWNHQTLWSCTFPEVNEALINTALRTQAVQHFIEKLRANTLFKRSVGGTKWSVDVKGLTFEKIEYDFWNNEELMKCGKSSLEKLDEIIQEDPEYTLIEFRG